MLKWKRNEYKDKTILEARTPIGYYLVTVYPGRATAASYPQSSTSLTYKVGPDEDAAVKLCNDHWGNICSEITRYNKGKEPYEMKEKPTRRNVQMKSK